MLAVLLAAAGCSTPDGWGELEYWNEGFACAAVAPSFSPVESGPDIAWISRRENALVYESGPPEQGATFGAKFRCEFYSSANRNDFVEVHATFESDARRVSTAVDELFASVVFATEEEHPGLEEMNGFEERWGRVGEWEYLDDSGAYPWYSQFQYVFEDANMYVRVKVQLQDREMNAELSEATFEMALAAAEAIREKSAYDFD